MVVTYRKNSTGQFMFELGGVVNSGVNYVALGISDMKQMEGASVMACSRWEIFLRVIFLLKEREGSERDNVLEPRNDRACTLCSPSRTTPWTLQSVNQHGR